jgi:uncharacterized membrane protein YgaE (UPF0421/DUF939 family)
MVSPPLQRLKQAWPDILLCAAASSAAWVLASTLFQHPQPIFAPIAAVVCLSPGVQSRGRQAVGLITGAITGVLVGALFDHLLVETAAALFVATALAMLAAAAIVVSPVLLIQAAVSAVLVVAGGKLAGETRIEDAAAGVALALLASQVLFTPDPVKRIERAIDEVLRALEACRAARRKVDLLQASTLAIAAMKSAVALNNEWEEAQSIASWSIRGRVRSGRLSKYARAPALAMQIAAANVAGASPPSAEQSCGPRVSADEALKELIRIRGQAFVTPERDH